MRRRVDSGRTEGGSGPKISSGSLQDPTISRGVSRHALPAAKDSKSLSAPADGLSIREFSRRDGCNEKLVRRAIGRGYLIANADGKLDPALVGSDWRRSNRRADKGADISADTADNDEGAAGEDISPPIPGENVLARLMRGKGFGIADADRIKANALAAKHVLAVRQSAGELISAELAERVLFDEARRARDAWDNWPARVGPMIAADLGLSADVVVEALKTHVHRQLDELGEPKPDSLGRAGGQP
jgi:hypothetical protein